MKVQLKLDELTNRIISIEQAEDNFGENIIEESEVKAFEDIDMTDKSLYFENGKIVIKKRNFDDLTEKIDAVESSLKDIEQFNYSNLIVECLLQGKNLDEANEAFYLLCDKKYELKNKLSKLTEQYSLLCRQKIETEQVGKIYKYYCSICLIIREDNEYLEEWLNWHINQGVEHFYIYDHGSKKPIAETIDEIGAEMQRLVTITDFSGSHGFAQHEAYNDCLKQFGHESRWIAFIDSDEMIRVKSGLKLTEFLKGYENYAGLFMAWIIYGANGHKNKIDEPLRKRFTSVSPSHASDNVGKVIVQPAFMKSMLTHNGYTKDGFFVVDEHKEPVEEAQTYKAAATTDLICVDHYYTKSYEEWLNKIKRGSCDPCYNRKYEEFFEYNPDMEYCRENTYPIQEYEISKI